jgi:hypothetical protein
MLAAAGARLARPALAAAVAHWVGDWRQAEQKRQAAEAAAAKQALMNSAGSIQSKLELQLAEVRLGFTLIPRPIPNPTTTRTPGPNPRPDTKPKPSPDPKPTPNANTKPILYLTRHSSSWLRLSARRSATEQHLRRR